MRCAVAWVFLYSVVWATGGRIDTTEAVSSWQLAPLEALQSAPVETVWHIHTQPPLWNALVGALLKASPFGLAMSLHLVMIVSGVVLTLAAFRIATTLGASVRVACCLTVLGTMSSQVLASGFSVRYDLPVAALLAALVGVVATRASATGLFVAVALATATVMMRALYHPLWLVAVVALVLLRYRGTVSARALVLAAVLPAVVVGGWMFKNDIQRGHFTMSTWTGMNLLRSVEPAVSADDMTAMLASKQVSGVAVVGTFQPYADYSPFVSACEPDSHLGVLAQPTKGTVVSGPFGQVVPDNFNYECFVDVYSQAGKDAVAIIRNHPGDWFEARTWAANNWFTAPSPATDSLALRAIHLATRITLLEIPHPGPLASWDGHEVWVHTDPESIGLAVFTAAALWTGARAFRRLLRRGDPRSTSTLLLVLLGFIVVWTMGTGVVMELGEQHRFRTVIDPLVVVAGGTAMQQWIATVTRRRRPTQQRDAELQAG